MKERTMTEYIRVRRCDVSQDSFEKTKGLAMEQAQDEHTQMLVCKVVGIVKTQEPVYEPLEDTEPEQAPKPRRKALDVTLEQKGRRVIAELAYVDPKLALKTGLNPIDVIATDGIYKVCFGHHLGMYERLCELTVCNEPSVKVQEFSEADAAAEYVERITKLLDIINANEPQEGGER
jgi:hypothetical protein